MNRSEIEQLRADIKSEYEGKISQLQAEMQADLRAIDRLEGRLISIGSSGENTPIVRTKFNHPIIVQPEKNLPALGNIPINKNVRKIVKYALGEMCLIFSREELKKKADELAGFTIKMGTFAPIFARLVKNGDIIESTKSSGSKAGIYTKPQEVKLPFDNNNASNNARV